MHTVTAPPEAPALHARLERQLNALLTISRRWRQFESDSTAAFKNITESAAAALAVDRVSIWMMDDARASIVCRDLYEYTRHRHTRGFKLARADNPAYFETLERDELIAASNAHTDPSTRAFTQGYLEPHGIGAMLDVPIRVGGRLVGVLCHEHVGGPRLFLSDEQTSARLLGNLASLACEIEGRRASDRRAAEMLALCEAAVESAALGVCATDLDRNVVHSNARLREIWRMPDEVRDQPARGELLAFTIEYVIDRDAFARLEAGQ